MQYPEGVNACTRGGGNTPLHLAAIAGSPALWPLLAAAPAAASAVNAVGMLPIHLAVRSATMEALTGVSSVPGGSDPVSGGSPDAKGSPMMKARQASFVDALSSSLDAEAKASEGESRFAPVVEALLRVNPQSVNVRAPFVTASSSADRGPEMTAREYVESKVTPEVRARARRRRRARISLDRARNVRRTLRTCSSSSQNTGYRDR